MTEGPQNSFCGASSIDCVSLKGLQLPFGITAPSVWGSPKAQPALLSINLVLDQGVGSAATQDALDENTVHYGTLAKRIRAGCKEDQTLAAFFSMVDDVVGGMGRRTDGTCRVSRAAYSLELPKASMYGKCVELSRFVGYDGSGKATLLQHTFGIRDMRLMCLIGVNDNERTAKQPLVAGLDLRLEPTAGEDVTSSYTSLFGIEQRLAKILESTSFETLESLISFTVKQLEHDVLCDIPSCFAVSLELGKPLAVLHAEAAKVSVYRKISAKKDIATGASTKSGAMAMGNSLAPLKIIKPYI